MYAGHRKQENTRDMLKDISDETEDILLLSHFNSLRCLSDRMSSGRCDSWL